MILRYSNMPIVRAADIDIAVDTNDEIEFDRIAESHYQAVAKYYPLAKMQRLNKEKGGYIYQITGVHREIEIYRSDRRHILTHHVPMTRGYITNSGTYFSASCLYSYVTKTITNYYYFAGKVSPMEILLKYRQRGFTIDIPAINPFVKEYIRTTQHWNSQYYALYDLISLIYTTNDEDFDIHSVFGNVDEITEMKQILDLSPAVNGYGNFNALDYYKQLSLIYDRIEGGTSTLNIVVDDYTDVLNGVRPNNVPSDAKPVLTKDGIQWISDAPPVQQPMNPGAYLAPVYPQYPQYPYAFNIAAPPGLKPPAIKPMHKAPPNVVNMQNMFNEDENGESDEDE